MATRDGTASAYSYDRWARIESAKTNGQRRSKTSKTISKTTTKVNPREREREDGGGNLPCERGRKRGGPNQLY